MAAPKEATVHNLTGKWTMVSGIIASAAFRALSCLRQFTRLPQEKSVSFYHFRFDMRGSNAQLG